MTARRIPARPTGRPDPPLCLSAHLEAGWDAETHVETPGGPDQHFACQPASSRAKPLQVHPGPPSAAPSHRFPCPARPSRPDTPKPVPAHEVSQTTKRCPGDTSRVCRLTASRSGPPGVPRPRMRVSACRRVPGTPASAPTRHVSQDSETCPGMPRVPTCVGPSRGARCPGTAVCALAQRVCQTGVNQ